jgi:hypothetical protein
MTDDIMAKYLADYATNEREGFQSGYIIANDDNTVMMAMAVLSPDVNMGEENRWILNRINTCTGVRKGQGWGNKLLTKVCAEADKYGVTLWLGVSPDAPGYFKRLARWYTRHGFKPLKRTLGPVNNVMIRKPR